MAEMETMYDTKILNDIRNTIIYAMKNRGYDLDEAFKISEAKEDRTVFKMELLVHDLNKNKIKNIVKYQLHYTFSIKDTSPGFVKLDMVKEYEHLASSN